MRIQLSLSMFAALSASRLGYVMRQRGELEIKVRNHLNLTFIVSLPLFTIHKWLSKDNLSHVQ